MILGLSDLRAWTDFEVFRITPPGKSDDIENARDKKAMENREKWLGKNYFFGPNSPASKAGQKKASITYFISRLIITVNQPKGWISRFFRTAEPSIKFRH